MPTLHALVASAAKSIDSHFGAQVPAATARAIAPDTCGSEISGRLLKALAASASIAAQQRRVEAALSAARLIAAGARSRAGIGQLKPILSAQAPVASGIAERARQVLQGTASGRMLPTRMAAMSAGYTTGAAASHVAVRRFHLDQRRRASALAHEGLARVQQQVDAREATAKEDRRRAACARLLDAPARPYRIETGRPMLDLSVMTKDDASLVLTLDEEVIVTTLHERMRRDRDQDAADARAFARAAEEQRIAEDRRRREVEEACRILRDTAKRPHRREGKTIRPDLSVLDESDRDILSAGLTHEAVKAAFRARIQRDYAADALDAVLKAIEAERIFVTADDKGYVADDAVRARFGVDTAATLSADAQVQLGAIADRQKSEIEPVAIHASNHPEHIVHETGGWTLSPKAPEHLRRVANAWRHEARLQEAFAVTSAAYRAPHPDVQPPAQSQPAVAGVTKPTPHQILIAAAAQRDALTEQWKLSGQLGEVFHNRAQPVGPERGQPPGPSSSPRRPPFPYDRGQGR